MNLASNDNILLQIVEYSNLDKDTFLSLSLNRLATRFNSKFIFFKYLPSYYSFIVRHSVGVDSSLTRSVGIDLSRLGKTETDKLNLNPEKLTSLQKLMSSLFDIEFFLAIPFKSPSGIDGFLVYTEPQESGELDNLKAYVKFICTYYMSKVVVEKAVLNSKISPLTGEITQREFIKELELEISKSRRALSRFTLLRICIDGIEEGANEYGEFWKKALSRSLFEKTKKLLRRGDQVFDLGSGNFAVVLLYTGVKRSTEIAESIYREISDRPAFNPTGKGRIWQTSVSVGISHYPEMSNTGIDLLHLAEKAMEISLDHGGSKISIAEVDSNFKPDYVAKSDEELSTAKIMRMNEL